MPLKPESRSFFLRAIWWFAGLALFLGMLVWGVAQMSRRMRIEQTQREFAQLQRMLEQFRVKNGEYPAVFNNQTLLRCLLGRADAKGHELAAPQPWFVTGAQLFFQRPDPTEPGNAIVDPWGTPYVYVYLFPIGGKTQGYMIFSAGPDRRHSNPLVWPPGSNGSKPEDADNLWVSTRLSPPASR